jgi:DNA-binding transcriptional LysR family regulator
MDRLRTMQSFVEVIRLGSFSEAAKTLGLSRPLVSRHITDLEKHLGVRLLTRTTRRITLTEAGAKHFEFCQRVITEIEQNEGSLKRTQKVPEGSLKILAPKSFTTLALGDAIASFAGANPYLNVSLMLDDLSFRAYDFVERGFDVAVHTTPVRNSNLVARKITHLRWLLCAAPAYLKKHGEPQQPRELARHQCLVHINSDPSDRVWRLGGAGQVSVKVQGPFASNSVLMLRKAALAGLGIAIVPLYCVTEDLKSGALREILSRFPIPVHPLSLVFCPGKPTPQKIRSLGDFLVGWFRKHPIPQ